MNNLCFLSNLTSSEWAAWIQAVGSVIAILAATLIAIGQSKSQHKNAILLHRTEQLSNQRNLAKTLFILAKNSAVVMQYTASKLNTKEAIYLAAQGRIPSNIGELKRIDTYLGAIPLHTMPFSLVTPTMNLGSIVRQCHEKLDMGLKLYRQMDDAMYEDLFKVLAEMNQSIEITCEMIELEVDSLEQVHFD